MSLNLTSDNDQCQLNPGERDSEINFEKRDLSGEMQSRDLLKRKLSFEYLLMSEQLL